MIRSHKTISARIALTLAAGLTFTGLRSQAQNAVATISSAPSGGGFNYTILLTDTGSTSLNSFWYGWTTSGNNLPSVPTTAGNSLGWGNSVSGNSIKWVNSTGTALTAGNSGTFTFFSTSTPTQVTTSPAGQSVAYVGGITFTQNNPGDSTPVFAPTQVVPEPSSICLLVAGSLGLLGAGRRRMRR